MSTKTPLSLTVNGQRRDFEVRPETPLLWVLRDDLGLTGTKFGCGKGLCGACTVHLDGEATRACVTPVEAVADRQVTTIEGLASGDGPHPLQQAWIDHQIAQCGYCQSGQIMNAAAFLLRKPEPSNEDVVAAMTGNLCRCGTYNRIRRAIVDAARTLREAGS